MEAHTEARFDFTIENIPADEAKVLMDFVDLVCKAHDWPLGGGYLMVNSVDEPDQADPIECVDLVDQKREAGDEQDA